MKVGKRQSGLSLMEMAVIIGTIALLVGLGLPAIRALVRSLETEGGARSVISAALSSARTMAMKEQRYAGVRFQKICLSRDIAMPLDGLLEAPQYMVFIIQDPNIMAYGFRAVRGLKPIKLSDTVGVIDISDIADNTDIDVDFELSNATSFSVVFSPSGKLAIHNVQVRNRDGDYRPINLDGSSDDIFNSPVNIIDNKTGMFIQDDYAELGLGAESSRNNFIIYDPIEFKKAYLNEQALSGYLSGLEAFYINAYTGTIIERD